MNRYDLVLFDFDGTLVDTAPDIAHHANQTLKAFGVPERTLEEVKRATGRGVRELLKELGIAEGEALDRAIRFMKESYAADPVIHTRPYPHVAAALEGPLAGVKKAVVTNKLVVLTDRILEKLDLRRHFEMVLGEGSGWPRKPDPGVVLHAMKTLGAEPARTLLIGDSAVDRQTAANAGISFAWAAYGYETLSGDGLELTRCESPALWRDFIIS